MLAPQSDEGMRSATTTLGFVVYYVAGPVCNTQEIEFNFMFRNRCGPLSFDAYPASSESNSRPILETAWPLHFALKGRQRWKLFGHCEIGTAVYAAALSVIYGGSSIAHGALQGKCCLM